MLKFRTFRWILAILILVITVFVLWYWKINSNEMSTTDVNVIHKEGEIISISITSKTLKRFIKAPSLSILLSNNRFVFSYSKLENAYPGSFGNGDVEITRKILSQDPVEINNTISGYFRIGRLPVYTEFIDYVGSLTNIQQLINEKGIDEEVKEYILIEPFGNAVYDFPVTIWVQTDTGSFFVTINEDLNSSNPHNVHFDYKAYTQEEFYKEYK